MIKILEIILVDNSDNNKYKFYILETSFSDPFKYHSGEIQITCKKNDNEKFSAFDWVERFDFYERSKNAFTVITTNKEAIYANIILKKSLITKNKSNINLKEVKNAKCKKNVLACIKFGRTWSY